MSAQVARAGIIANESFIRAQLVSLIDDDPRITVVASVPILDAEPALTALTPSLIIAHGASDAETTLLHGIATNHPDIFFMLIVSGITAPSSDPEALNYVTAVERDLLEDVVPDLIHVASESIQVADNHSAVDREKRLLETLTSREHEILILTAEGLRIKEIAEKINRSPATVAKHQENIMNKVHMHDRVALTRLAIRAKLIEP